MRRLYALRFLRLLTMPWIKTDAFKQGIVDDKGVKVKKPETPKEKSSYTVFHKLVFNIRRLLGKIPLGQSTIARFQISALGRVFSSQKLAARSSGSLRLGFGSRPVV